jgi:hypothetical protein
MELNGRRISVLAPVFLLAVLSSCSDDSSSSPSPSGTPVAANPTPTSTPTVATPTPTALPTATPTPAATCGLSLSDARFEPSRLSCPAGTSTQTVRLVFELGADGDLPVTVNRVTSSNVTCRIAGGTCTWPEGPLSFSPSVVPARSRAQIVATTTFSCGSFGTGPSGELIFGLLFVNTSCGPAREIKVTNSLALG